MGVRMVTQSSVSSAITHHTALLLQSHAGKSLIHQSAGKRNVHAGMKRTVHDSSLPGLVDGL